MSFTVERLRRRTRKAARPEQELRCQLVLALKSLLTPATYCAGLEGVEDGRLVFIHGGRAFYLELKAPKAYLTPPQRALHVALRDAGARVEVARSLAEALAHLRGFGIPLRAVSLKTVFRQVA